MRYRNDATLEAAPTNQVTMIGIDIGKNSFHLIGLDDRLGSRTEVQREPRNVRSWGSSGSRFRTAGCLLVAISRLSQIHNSNRMLSQPNDGEVVLLAIHLIQLMTLAGRVFKKNLIAGFNNSVVAVAGLQPDFAF